MLCLKCSSTCSACSGTAATQCTACPATIGGANAYFYTYTYSLDEGSCVTGTPSVYYDSANSRYYIGIILNPNRGAIDGCPKGYYYENATGCVTSMCPDMYHPPVVGCSSTTAGGRTEKGECITCYGSCGDCRTTASNGCISCKNSSYRLELTAAGTSGTCVSALSVMDTGGIVGVVIVSAAALGVVVGMGVMMARAIHHQPKEEDQQYDDMPQNSQVSAVHN